MTPSNEPTERDWIDLSQALGDAEWTINHARAILQEAEGWLKQVHWWQHPVLWLKLWHNVRWLRRSTELAGISRLVGIRELPTPEDPGEPEAQH